MSAAGNVAGDGGDGGAKIKSATPVQLMKALYEADKKEIYTTYTDSDGKTQKIVGSIDAKGGITVVDAANVKTPYTSPLKFLREQKEAVVDGYKVANNVWKKQIFFEDDGADSSLEDYAASSAASGAGEGVVPKRARAFSEDNAITSVGELHTFHSQMDLGEHATPKYVYRVLRLNEVEDWSAPKLTLSGTPVQEDNIAEFCLRLFNHVNHGTGGSEESRIFISTTADPAVAAWWSHNFVQPVARIETAKCKRVWSPALLCSTGGVLHGVNPQFDRTAAKSREYLIDGGVPAEAVTKYEPKRVCVRAASFVIESPLSTSPPSLSTPDFPDTFDELSPVTMLGGTTEAMKVHAGSGSSKQYFVLKQGRGGQMPGTTLASGAGSHCSAEFFALRMYSIFGVPVPSAALYRMHTIDEEARLDIVTFALLTQHIPGLKYAEDSDEATKSIQAHALFDLALANFDVCGVGFSNLIHSREHKQVYRVDAGCNVAFSAGGIRQTMGTINMKEELKAFKEHASNRSEQTVSKVHVQGWGRQWEKSGPARVKLLNPELINRNLKKNIGELLPHLPDIKSAMNEWLFSLPGLPSLWVDMMDTVFSRIDALKVLMDEV